MICCFDWMINKMTYYMCIRLNFNVYSLPAHELIFTITSLSLSLSLISSSKWFALNSFSFSSWPISSNSIGKYIFYTLLTSFIAALNSFIHRSTRLRFWCSGSLVESKWCHKVMVEADSHLKLFPLSVLDIYKVFEYIDMLSIGTIW